MVGTAQVGENVDGDMSQPLRGKIEGIQVGRHWFWHWFWFWHCFWSALVLVGTRNAATRPLVIRTKSMRQLSKEATAWPDLLTTSHQAEDALTGATVADLAAAPSHDTAPCVRLRPE